MRIITGSLKGRIFNEPHGHHTHPMSEKVRGALFNTLGDIEGLTVLDAFAGSGALSFEAASRGAAKVTAIDKDTAAHQAIAKNIKELGLEKSVHASKASAAGWSIHNMEKRFDILLLDPPFDILLLDPPYKDLQIGFLQKLINRHVKKGGLAVLSYPGKIAAPDFERAEVAASKKYNDAQLVFYRKIK
jgi:16S rRNA (guanine(966)-N(2))-methyltransferase RsmD